MADRPSEAEIATFLDGLRSYRATIPARQQEMLDTLILRALEKRQSAEQGAEVKAYWSAYNPPGAAGGYGRVNPPGYGYGYGVPGGVGW
jgi:hypothetical protein